MSTIYKHLSFHEPLSTTSLAQLALKLLVLALKYSDRSQRLWSINLSSEVVTYYKFNHPNFDATFDNKTVSIVNSYSSVQMIQTQPYFVSSSRLQTDWSQLTHIWITCNKCHWPPILTLLFTSFFTRVLTINFLATALFILLLSTNILRIQSVFSASSW